MSESYEVEKGDWVRYRMAHISDHFCPQANPILTMLPAIGDEPPAFLVRGDIPLACLSKRYRQAGKESGLRDDDRVQVVRSSEVIDFHLKRKATG